MRVLSWLAYDGMMTEILRGLQQEMVLIQ